MKFAVRLAAAAGMLNVSAAAVEVDAPLHALNAAPLFGVAVTWILSPLTYLPAAHAALLVGLGALTVPSTDAGTVSGQQRWKLAVRVEAADGRTTVVDRVAAVETPLHAPNR
jgi:hypothetical protein